MGIVVIPCDAITDWPTFHEVFAKALGFPQYYGRNMNAWIDCMTYVDEPDAGMTSVTVAEGDVLTLQLDSVGAFAERCPEQYADLVECSAFVNWRRIDQGERPILALSFHNTRGYPPVRAPSATEADLRRQEDELERAT